MDSEALETPELVLADVEEADIDAVVAVRRSNPERLARTEGTDRGPGDYDRSMLERDLTVVGFDPARSFLAARRRADGAVVGYVDILDRHPEDGLAWLGAVEIRAADQRLGYGRQCVEAVARRARDVIGAPALRAAVDADDEAASGFLERSGFVPVAKAERRSPRGPVEVTVLERRL